MLNLDMFARVPQPFVEKLPTFPEVDEEDECSDSSYDSDDDGKSFSTSNDVSSTSDVLSSINRSEASSAIQQSLAMIESRKICWLRGIVLVAILIATIILASVVNNATTRSEHDKFESQFDEHASKILTAFQTNIHHGIGEIDNLALSITSYSQGTNTNWPYAVIPEFEIRAASTRHLADAALIALVPLVPEIERVTWEGFSEQARNWSENNLMDVTQNEPTTNRLFIDPSRKLRQRWQQEKQDDAEAQNFEMELILEDFFLNYGATNGTLVNFTNGVAEQLYTTDGKHMIVDEHPGPFYPIWQSSPALSSVVNFNLISHQDFGEEVQLAIDSNEVILGKVADISKEDDPFKVLRVSQDTFVDDTPVGKIFFPVYDKSSEPRSVVSFLIAIIQWTDYLQATNLPPEANGIVCVLRNQCNQEYSFQIYHGETDKVIYLGEGDLHDEHFDYLEVSLDIEAIVNYAESEDDQLTYSGIRVNEMYCPYSLHVYPSEMVQATYITRNPVIYTIVVIVIFLMTGMIFVWYDYVIEKRQKVLVDRAVKSHQIVSNLFPEVVRDRLFGDDEDKNKNKLDEQHPVNKASGIVHASPSKPLEPLLTEKIRLKSFLHTGFMTKADEKDGAVHPIADLFTHCTVLFADIAGFTAWSSVREPAQVFTLLEAVYAAFDKIAVKRRVFKVETIGDCYVAVTGLPDPQPNHATIMARFARDCLGKMRSVTRKLEVDLGPETGDLSMRFGLHSGPVTAGVLRGQKSRFQLFGDTVNTAARMESTGKSDMIQCSQATANILTDCGKGAWLFPREDPVEAKGKGTMRTFWVMPKSQSSNSAGRASHQSGEDSQRTESVNNTKRKFPDKMGSFGSYGSHHSDSDLLPRKGAALLTPHQQRLVGWTVELLTKLLKNMVAHRKSTNNDDDDTSPSNYQRETGLYDDADDDKNFEEIRLALAESECPRDEYAEYITMPKFDPSKAADTMRHHHHQNGSASETHASGIELDPGVEDQLRDYVTTIACLYHQSNRFHNFEHASHVTMSANKILKRIVAADDYCDVAAEKNITSVDAIASNLHSFTYGITSDPLTHFTCVFAAMVHDVDHPGVSNMQLKIEEDELSDLYDGKSTAEQNSIDIAWDLLMDPVYDDFRRCIYTNEEEYHHFRNLLVNSVMATDIFDPELVAMRNRRWQKAFSQNNNNASSGSESSGSSSTTTGTATTEATTTDGDVLAIDEEDHTADRKATIVIEHIIQASDVAHTMQHWHVYQKWNERLFEEMTIAYRAGRLDKDPALGWYKGELWFYDNYIIPLAKKLKNCGVFGVASDEFLTYAMDNRNEWEVKGEAIVQQMEIKLKRKERDISNSTNNKGLETIDSPNRDSLVDESLSALLRPRQSTTTENTLTTDETTQ